MGSRLLSVAVLGILVFGAARASAGDADPNKNDLALLQGRWVVVSVERDGRTLAGADEAMRGVTFEGETFRWDGDEESGTLKLDATTKPKSVDYTNADGSGGQSPVYRGVYKITRETFRDCFVLPGVERPRSLMAMRGEPVTCVSYKRDIANDS